MTRRHARTIFQSALLTVLLTSLAFAVTHVKPGVTLWRHHSGQTLTEVQMLPASFWGFGTTPVNMPTATGAPVNAGSVTRCGFCAVCRYDLRVWNYDPKSGSMSYTVNGGVPLL